MIGVVERSADISPVPLEVDVNVCSFAHSPRNEMMFRTIFVFGGRVLLTETFGFWFWVELSVNQGLSLAVIVVRLKKIPGAHGQGQAI